MGDDRVLVRTARDGGGRPGTTRVMAGTEGPSAKNSPSGPYPPGRSPS